MFRWLSNFLFTSAKRASNRSRAVRMLRARYDAASTSDENRRHWANADGLSANSANSAEVRRILRNRARYEVCNNSYARGIVLTLANDVVGTGPRLQLLTRDSEINTRIEREFTGWARAIRLSEKLRTMVMSKITDGEAFGLLVNNPELSTDVKLDIRLIEADQVTTPDLNSLQNPSAVDGIVFDDAGNPVEYHVLRHHPGDSMAAWSREYDRIPANLVLHWFRVDRPGQARGIPDLTPALPLFAQLRRYTLAVLAAAETAADFAGILYTDAPADGADTAEPFEPIELEKRALVTMPAGWKMSQLQAEQPATTYAEFKHEILNEIARCLNMPFNIAAGNSSGYNYASGRLDHQTYFKTIRVEQAHLEAVVLDRILMAWLDEAALIPDLLPAGLGPFSLWPHQWFWDGHEHVDPVKEAQAQALRLSNHTTTLAHEYARQGRDWEEALRQRAKELALMAELGLMPVKPESTDIPEDEEEYDDVDVNE